MDVKKFNQFPSFMKSPGCSQTFSLVLAKNSFPNPKNQNFCNMKNITPDIYPRNNCLKFQTSGQTYIQILSDSNFDFNLSWEKKRREFLRILVKILRYKPRTILIFVVLFKNMRTILNVNLLPKPTKQWKSYSKWVGNISLEVY